MNITNLKTLVANLPNEITPEQFALIEADVEELLAQQRQADSDELNQLEMRAMKLREKLGFIEAPPPVRPPAAQRVANPLDETDAGMGVREPRDDNVSAQSFTDELAELRERTQAKRRRLA